MTGEIPPNTGHAKKFDPEDATIPRKLLLISGGSASGKSTAAYRLSNKIDGDSMVIQMDDYFYPSAHPEQTNFDTPDMVDLQWLEKNIRDLMAGKEVIKPTINFEENNRGETETVEPSDFIIVEGLFVHHSDELLNRADQVIYIEAPGDTRFERKFERDIASRGMTEQESYHMFIHETMPGHMEYVEEGKSKADLVVSGNYGVENMMADITHRLRGIPIILEED